MESELLLENFFVFKINQFTPDPIVKQSLFCSVWLCATIVMVLLFGAIKNSWCQLEFTSHFLCSLHEVMIHEVY